MANGQSPHYGNAQIKAAFAQHFLEAEAGAGLIVWGFTALKPAKAKARQLLQGSTEAPVGQQAIDAIGGCLLYTSPSPRDATLSRMPSSA